MGSQPLPIRGRHGRLRDRRNRLCGFWRDLEFKAAAICAASIFLLGDAVGHVRQMMEAGNFAPGNAGVPFYMDILCPVLAIALVVTAKRPAAPR